jgi:hypothetical protein
MLGTTCGAKDQQPGRRTMTTDAPATSDRPSETPFLFEYSSIGGPELGSGVHERESHLRLNSADHLALLEKHRSDSDAPGEAIGLFRAELPADTFLRIRDLVSKTRLAQLGPPARGGPGTSVITLKYKEGNNEIQKQFTSLDTGLIQQVEDLIFEVVQILVVLNRSPEQAVQVSVSRDPASPSFSLKITNLGTKEVCFADPRYLPSGNQDRYAGVRWAEYPPEQPGMTAPPLQWSFVSLAPPLKEASSGTREIILGPGKSFEASTGLWKPTQQGKRYLVQGVLSDYVGPRDVDGCYRIRGAAFSKSIEINR